MKKSGFQRVLATMALFGLTLILVLSGCKEDGAVKKNNEQPPTPVVAEVAVYLPAIPQVKEGVGGDLNCFITVFGTNISSIDLTKSADVKIGELVGNAIREVPGISIKSGTVTVAGPKTPFVISVADTVPLGDYDLVVSVLGVTSEEFTIEVVDELAKPKVTSLSIAQDGTAKVTAGTGGPLNFNMEIAGENIIPLDLTTSEMVVLAVFDEDGEVITNSGITISSGLITATEKAFVITVANTVTAGQYGLVVSVLDKDSNKAVIEVIEPDPLVPQVTSVEVAHTDGEVFRGVVGSLSYTIKVVGNEIAFATPINIADIILITNSDGTPFTNPTTGTDGLFVNATNKITASDTAVTFTINVQWPTAATFTVKAEVHGTTSNSVNLEIKNPPLTGTASILDDDQHTMYLGVDVSNINGTGSYTFQWQRSDDADEEGVGTYYDVGGPVTVTYYDIPDEDFEYWLRALITCEGFSGNVIVGPIFIYDPNELDIDGNVDIDGDFVVGEQLTATANITNSTYAPIYRWEISDDDDEFLSIPQAMGNTYVVRRDDVGKYIRVAVSTTNRKGHIYSDSDEVTASQAAQLTVTEQLAALRALDPIPSAYIIYTNDSEENIAPQTLTAATFTSPITITLSGSPGDKLTLSAAGAMFTLSAKVTLILESIELVGRAGNTAAVIDTNGGTLVMKAGSKISGNTNTTTTTTGAIGGGVRVNGGTFNMEDGEISGNTCRYGGGVAVNTAGSVFNMSGGTIKGNTATGTASAASGQGGGVFVTGVNATSIATFTMTGGSITENTASSPSGNAGGMGGGVFVQTYGRFELKGGTISKNIASASGTTTASVPYGGGIYNAANGRTLIYGGTITGNTAFRGTAAGQGGGILNTGAGVLSITGGVISNNTAYQGGGLATISSGVTDLSTAIIYGAEAPEGLRNISVNTNTQYAYADAILASSSTYLSVLNPVTHDYISDYGTINSYEDFTVDVLNGVTQYFGFTGLPDNYWGAARHPLGNANQSRVIFITIVYDDEEIDYGGLYLSGNSPYFSFCVTPGKKFEAYIDFVQIAGSSQVPLGSYIVTIDPYQRGDNVIPYSSFVVNEVSSLTLTDIPAKYLDTYASLFQISGTSLYLFAKGMEARDALVESDSVTYTFSRGSRTAGYVSIMLSFNPNPNVAGTTGAIGVYQSFVDDIYAHFLTPGANTISYFDFVDLLADGRVAPPSAKMQSGQSGNGMPFYNWEAITQQKSYTLDSANLRQALQKEDLKLQRRR